MATMDADERAALESYLDGCCKGTKVDALTTKKALGVLRLLWPEFYDQLRPRRGRKANIELRHVVNSRFTMLTNPRMRDDNPELTGTMGRPYTTSEAITKIAFENHISEDYARELTEVVRGDLKAELTKSVSCQAQSRKDAIERQSMAILDEYEQAFRDDFFELKIKVAGDVFFEKYLVDSHNRAAMAAADSHGQAVNDVLATTQKRRRKLVDEFRTKRAAHLLREKIEY